jgi:hypothetical protein
MIPEYLRGRKTIEDELEDILIVKKPYYKRNILKGQTRGKQGWFFKKVVNTETISGVFKCINVIQMPDDDPKILYEEYKKYLTPHSLVCRVYILKGKSLTPNDSKNSDPYLLIKCGRSVVNDSKNVIDDTNNPGFYKHFDIAVSIPGASTLTIQVWDDDGIVGDDLIGETKIDLEERFFDKTWREINDTAAERVILNQTKKKSKKDKKSTQAMITEDKSEKGTPREEEKVETTEISNEYKKIPIEERTLAKKTSAAPQGVIE